MTLALALGGSIGSVLRRGEQAWCRGNFGQANLRAKPKDFVAEIRSWQSFLRRLATICPVLWGVAVAAT